jgi:hypothetical protein
MLRKFTNIVYPGDEITSIWTLDTITNKWLDTWSVMPGKIGTGKGEVPYGGNYTFDGSLFGMFCLLTSIVCTASLTF